MVEPILIGYGNNKWIKDSDTKLVTLTEPLTSWGTGYASLKDSSTNNAYIVPAGKKFIILTGLMNFENEHGLKKHTVENSSGGTLLCMIPKNTVVNLFIEVEAGKYINNYYSNYYGVLVGVETNA